MAALLNAMLKMELLKPDTLYLAGALLLLTAAVNFYQVSNDPLAKIPGPWYNKWSSWPYAIQAIRGKLPEWVHGLHAKYGPVVRTSPTDVDIADLSAIKRIHSAKDGFLKSPFYTKLITGSDGIFNTVDPAKHRKYKRLLSNPMSETGLRQFLPQIDARVRLAIRRIRDEERAAGRADLVKWFMLLSFDIIGELTFGESFGNLERGTRNQSVDDFGSLGFIGGLRSTFPLIAALSAVVPIPVFSNSTKVMARTFAYAEQALARHEKLVADNGGADPHPTIFSKLYNAQHDETWSAVEVRDNAQVTIVGGSDTTANSMAYLVWAVCRNPHIRRSLLKELDDNLGPAHNPKFGPDDAFDHDALRHLPYLNAVIDETLRVYNTVPAGLPRAVPPGGCELAGHYIPAAATVTTQAYSLHRDEEAFPDPERFDPDRWLDPTPRMKDCLMPFGGGARTCVGRHLARIETRLICARFFRAFPHATMSTMEGMSDKDMEPALHFLMEPSGHRCLFQLNVKDD